MKNKKHYYRVLSIAGSDPSGGAGLQADIKTISACGCFATTAITAVVNENTLGVTGVHPIPIDFVIGQIRSVLDDIGADAIKIGMLHSAELVMAVKNTLSDYPEIKNIVLDPVMVATSGDPLLEKDAIDTLKNELIPMARIITPNLPEAEILLGEKIRSENLSEAAILLSKENQGVSVFMKAGHLSDKNLIDYFYNGEDDKLLPLSSERVDTRNTHGTGCTLSSAIASFLARGEKPDQAAIMAKRYISEAIKSGAEYNIGHGNGPVNHFFRFNR
ncbi:MAG: bifunctional hydroxymethylpyrimidine kinase/phosphomethylpyrimidine kinase [Muribaculaceae bacterium]|nr:bifunctional hydroxymethylpyrimidine kinase/phosphomethylpyrimidine kinase [Muribaculaceae bacterium]